MAKKEPICRHKVTKKRVQIGDVITSFRGETYWLMSFQAPHTINSTGRVYVLPVGAAPTDSQEAYFPAVFDLEVTGGVR